MLKSLIALHCLFFGYSYTGLLVSYTLSEMRDRSDWHLGGVGGLLALRSFRTLSVLKKEVLAFMAPDSIAGADDTTGVTKSKGIVLLVKSGVARRGDKTWDDLFSEALGESFCLEDCFLLVCCLMYFKPAIVSFLF